MTYKVIRSSSIDILQDTVNELLEFGWELCGGPFFANNCYHQALTRKH